LKSESNPIQITNHFDLYEASLTSVKPLEMNEL